MPNMTAHHIKVTLPWLHIILADKLLKFELGMDLAETDYIDKVIFFRNLMSD